MIKTKLLLLCFILVSSYHAIFANKLLIKAITHGHPVTKPEYYQFFIGIMYADQYRCGATLIARNFAMTAAHCVIDNDSNQQLPIDKFTLNIGQKDTSSQGYLTTRKVTQIYLPPEEVQLGSNGYDIALLKLESPVTDIKPVRIASISNDFVGKEALVIGLGATKSSMNDPQMAQVLQTVEVEIVDKTICALDASIAELCIHSLIDDSASDPDNPYANASFGDSGGPLLLGKAGAYTQVGIVRGVPLGVWPEDNQNAVFTDVSKFNQFIRQILKANQY